MLSQQSAVMINQQTVVMSVVINGLQIEIGKDFMRYGNKQIEVDKSTTIENVADALGLPSSESAFAMCDIQIFLKSHVFNILLTDLEVLNTHLNTQMPN